MESRPGVLVAFILFFSSVSSAQITAEVLMYRGFAHEARDRQGAAEVDHTAARVRLRRAQFDYDMKTRLFAGNASSAFDVSNAILELARARHQETRTAAELVNSATLEKVWRLRADSVEKSQDHTREIAELYVKARLEIVRVAESGLTNIRPIAAEVTFQFRRSQQLYAQHAISREEMFLIETVSDEVRTFIPFAEHELADAKANLAEALRDLDSLPQPKP